MVATAAHPLSPLSHLFHPTHVDRYVDSMHLGVEHLATTLRRLTGPSTGTPPHVAAGRVAEIDLDRPLADTEDALDEMSRIYLDDAIWFHDPDYAAHLNCPVVIPSLLAEIFVSGVNSSLDTFDQSVGGTFVERRLIDWTAGRIGFDQGADGIFTSGGTQSNLQALMLARGHAQATHGPHSVLRIFASTDAHFSVQTSARLLGLGDDAVIPVTIDGDRRMDPGALSAALARCSARGDVPMAVVATAGTTDFGAIDPLATVSALAESYGAWLHVDAAYGGGLLASRTRRHLLQGIDQADSVTVDYHKTWFQPVSSSALIVRDSAHLQRRTWHADYLNPAVRGTSPNQVDKSLQTTRRFDALKLWLTLRIMGPDVIGGYVDDIVELTAEVAARLDGDPAIELAAAPQLSTLVFRYRPNGVSEDEADDLTPRIRAALYESGRAMVAATKVEGRDWLKLTLLNPLATPDQILSIIARVSAVGDRLVSARSVV